MTYGPLRRAFALLCAVVLATGTLPPGLASAATPPATIGGTVYAADGSTPIGGVYVYAVSLYDGTWTDAWTAGDGSYSLSFDWPADAPSSVEYIVLFDPFFSNALGATFFVDEWFSAKRSAVDADLVTLGVSAPSTSTVDATLDVGGMIAGRIFDADGTTPMGGTFVEVVDATGGYVVSTTADGDGYYSVYAPVGTFKVTASGDGAHAAGWYGGTSLADAADVGVDLETTTSDIDVSLADGATISGRVTDHGGSPVEGVDVYSWLEGALEASYAASTDASGAYTVMGLAAGSYGLSFEVDTWRDANPTEEPLVRQVYDDAAADTPTYITVSGSDEASGTDVVLDHGGSVGGYVRDQTGAPIDGVEILMSGSVVATTGADGSYLVEHLERRTQHALVFDPSARNFAQDSSFGTTEAVAAVETTGLVPLDVTLMIVDLAPPATDISFEPDGWTSGDATFTLSADDGPDGSGVDATYYDLGDGAGPQDYVGPVPLTEEGVTVAYWSVDREGNEEQPSQGSPPIDRTAPHTSTSTATGLLGTTMITLTPYDAGSGVLPDSTWYQLDGSPVATGTVALTALSGWHKLDFGSVDNVGNREATETLDFYVDPGMTWPTLTVGVIRQPRRYVVFTGAISPHPSWSTVSIVIERKSGRRWKRWRTYVTSVPPGSSVYSRRVRMPSTATHRVRTFHGDADHYGTWTGNRTFRASARRR